jgi:hypothetical protein
MRTIVALVLSLLASEAFAARFKWTVEIFDSESSEVRNFEPPDEEWKVPIPRSNFTCTLLEAGIDTNSTTTFETRGISCQTPSGDDFVVMTNCSRRKGSKSPTLMSFATFSVLAKKAKGYHISLRCSD